MTGVLRDFTFTIFLGIFSASLILALIGTPVARRAALHLNIVDHPSSRKIHAAPMPYLGGAAIYLAFLAIVLVAVRTISAGEIAGGIAIQQLLAILGGATAMAILGLFDDRYDLPSLLRLGLQSLAAIVLIASGVNLHFNHFAWLLDGPVSFVWVVGLTNAFNLLDNMDGLSVGVAATGSAYFFLLAYLAHPTQFLVASLAAALSGACLGFLRYNFNPARIFMGDAGAYFLGFLLAAIGMKLRISGSLHAVTWIIPIVVLGLPIFDTTLVTISRLRRGLSPGKGGKDHTSHRLVKAGMTHREAVMAIYLVCGALGTSSLVLTRASLFEALAYGVILVAAASVAFIYMERIYHAPAAAPRMPAPPLAAPLTQQHEAPVPADTRTRQSEDSARI